MHTGSHYRLKEFLHWTQHSIFLLFVIAFVPTFLYEVVGWKWLGIPWVPIALIGTAAAFIAGFRNNATYDRMWEARKIWGSIINSSRTWGIMVRDYIRADEPETEKEIHRALIYRHIAWLTALRFQLRTPKNWENIHTKKYNRKYLKRYTVPEWETDLAEELKPFLSEKERQHILSKKNRATQLIALQSGHLKALNGNGKLDTLCLVEMENVLNDFYVFQGQGERIKNFPYPRQFASINLFFIRLLVWMLPFGMLNEFDKLGAYWVWLTVPFSIVVGWVFTSLEQVGESTENPFEGSANDIPMAALSRTIEIDLRDMLDETDLPPAAQPVNNILM
ncbi:bestrophin family protein [Sinomicrobium weinanense]|uniref:Multidrug transporter n=1 Tax=Sinomicrobium weinanense TaxID=2842200 RepID=A0A926Q4Q6_9FLAO|nr:bestrophin family ion channel [Sinomicrobium weinanense]MBC9797336.1 multidrug transporter [Sinomicrobium weinanense]MBU3124516.1 multidrug transporter [Sinomicrobium weinanense]